jgi:hypothetical protein
MQIKVKRLDRLLGSERLQAESHGWGRAYEEDAHLRLEGYRRSRKPFAALASG